MLSIQWFKPNEVAGESSKERRHLVSGQPALRTRDPPRRHCFDALGQSLPASQKQSRNSTALVLTFPGLIYSSGQMDIDVILTCILIIVARIADVSLGTLRTVFVVHGRKGISFILGFVEVLIWITVVSRVVNHIDYPIYAVSYALGFAIGTYVGLTIEGLVSLGDQVVRLFTRQADLIEGQLRDMQLQVTRFEGQGRDGPVAMLFLEAPRRRVGEIIKTALALDSACFYIVDHVRLSAGIKPRWHTPSGWRAIFKRK